MFAFFDCVNIHFHTERSNIEPRDFRITEKKNCDTSDPNLLLLRFVDSLLYSGCCVDFLFERVVGLKGKTILYGRHAYIHTQIRYKGVEGGLLALYISTQRRNTNNQHSE